MKKLKIKSVLLSIMLFLPVAACITIHPNDYLEIKNAIPIQTDNQQLLEISQHCGIPTTDCIKLWLDLAHRIGYNHTKRPPSLPEDVVEDLQRMLVATKPLHFSYNPILEDPWHEALANYRGAKTGVSLYKEIRSKATNYLDRVLTEQGEVKLYSSLRASTHKPPEFHHLLYKAKYPGLATDTKNLMLVGRSESEKRLGPGQHELIHLVSSGNDKDKFNVLLPQFVQVYQDWIDIDIEKV